MGTHSVVTFYEKIYNSEKYERIVSVYQQYDGYVTGVGFSLCNFLNKYHLVNGIGIDDINIANGAQCLAALFIRDFKLNAGGLYILPKKQNEDYNYDVYISGTTLTKIKASYFSKKIFEGNLVDFNTYIKTQKENE